MLAKVRCLLLGLEVALLLEVLGDGQWHALAELQQQAGLVEYELRAVAEFLCRFGFAFFDEEERKVRVSRGFQRFLART
ncbi:MAG: hypothetical protein NWE94_01310 [Candidatus Bathyarchaeota archaeon]|nr:hypothetical protein [Candidatus Bathyarchaeota archaeon]